MLEQFERLSACPARHRVLCAREFGIKKLSQIFKLSYTYEPNPFIRVWTKLWSRVLSICNGWTVLSFEAIWKMWINFDRTLKFYWVAQVRVLELFKIIKRKQFIPFYKTKSTFLELWSFINHPALNKGDPRSLAFYFNILYQGFICKYLSVRQQAHSE